MSKAIIRCPKCDELIEVYVKSIFRTVSTDTSGEPTKETIRYEGDCPHCGKEESNEN